MADAAERPRGHYLASEVGLLAGVSGERIGQWAFRGYISASQSTGDPYVYSYQDIGEAMVVHELEEAGADLHSIKRAIERLRERHGTAWPLQGRADHLGALHGTVVEFESGTAIDIGGRGSPLQEVLPDQSLRQLAGQLERGGWVVRNLPELRHIEVNPDRMSGRPVIRATRTPASMVAELAERPEGLDILREDFGLSDEQIADARTWCRALARAEAAASS